MAQLRNDQDDDRRRRSVLFAWLYLRYLQDEARRADRRPGSDPWRLRLHKRRGPYGKAIRIPLTVALHRGTCHVRAPRRKGRNIYHSSIALIGLMRCWPMLTAAKPYKYRRPWAGTYDPLFESRDAARLLDNRPSNANAAAISSALCALDAEESCCGVLICRNIHSKS